MISFRLPKTSWIKIGLSSIALHLALLSALSGKRAQSEATYLPTVEISLSPAPIDSLPKPARLKAVAGGASQAAEGSATPPHAFSSLRESLYRVLSYGLKTRSKSLGLLLSLKFSKAGVMERTEIVESSGQAEVDSEILYVLKSARLYSSPDLANLKVQVPIRLR